MRVLAIDHGTVRMGIAISDELKMIAQPLEFIPAEPFSGFLDRIKFLLSEYEVELLLLGMPRNMDGSYGDASIKVKEFEAILKKSTTIPIKTPIATHFGIIDNINALVFLFIIIYSTFSIYFFSNI